MTRYLFISLDRQRQLMMLRSEGMILHHRIRGKCIIKLYKIKNFYIEVWYDSIGYEIQNLVTFKDRSLLNYKFNLKKA
ncbi:MAG TPA: hypothetical protein DCX54_11420 [Flavobacteriales bacterium]|nr:hypothetical protein [Flavobacteriales bacterium]